MATGASDFFFLDDRQRDTARLPDATLRPALAKPAHATGDVLTAHAHAALGPAGRPRWLFDLNGRPDLYDDDDVRAYERKGRARDLHLRHLTKNRTPWYLVEHVTPPDVLLCPVGKTLHRVISNDASVVGSNNFYGIYMDPVAPWTAAQLAAWLRTPDGQAALRQLARTYQGGSMKIEPRSLRGLLVPLPSPDEAPPHPPTPGP